MELFVQRSYEKHHRLTLYESFLLIAVSYDNN